MMKSPAVSRHISIESQQCASPKSATGITSLTTTENIHSVLRPAGELKPKSGTRPSADHSLFRFVGVLMSAGDALALTPYTERTIPLSGLRVSTTMFDDDHMFSASTVSPKDVSSRMRGSSADHFHSRPFA